MIIIDADSRNSGYFNNDYKITIKREPYESLQLFYYVRYTLNPSTQSTINISKNKKLHRFPETIVEPVQHVDLYYSIFNQDKILIFGIKTENSLNYYDFSSLKRLKRAPRTTIKKIQNADLTEKLIDLIERINHKIIYVINNKKSYNSITVADNNSTLPKFSYYIHSPKKYGYKVKQPIVIYNGEIFEPQLKHLNFKGKIQLQNQKIGIDEFNFKQIDSIKVNFSKTGDLIILVEIVQHPKTYYYTLRNKYEKSWIQVDVKNDGVYGHLVDNEKRLIYSFVVLLHMKESYTNVETEHSTKISISDKEDEKTIKIEESTAENLKEAKYFCYEQYLESYYEYKSKHNSSLSTDHKYTSHSSVKKYSRIYIYNFNIRLDIFDGKDENDYLLYLSGYKLNVFFYKDDNYPLLIEYGHKFYGATTIDDYFKKWSKIDSLTKNHDDPKKILVELERINRMLNEVNINKVKSYGICDEIIDKTFDTTRVIVSSKSYQKDNAYLMVTHIPKNKCIIGKSFYNKSLTAEDIIDYTQGVGLSTKPYNDQFKIVVDAISATVYYFKYDEHYKYPLLIEYYLEEKKYTYYVLKNDDYTQIQCGSDVKDKLDDDCLNKILNHQNFIYHKVIDIRLDKKCMYTCCDIDDSNTEYIKHVPIHKIKHQYCKLKTKTDVRTTEIIPIICSSHENGFQLLNGYKVFKHTIKTIKTDNGDETSDPRSNVIKIKGFKINDNTINLYDYSYVEQISISETYKNTYLGEIYVCFYQEDPRPLLLYYDHNFYLPMSKDYYHHKWIQVQYIKDLTSNRVDFIKDKKILQELYKVTGFLNTVRLDQDITITKSRKTMFMQYDVHKFKNSHVNIFITGQLLKNNRQGCYKKLVHTHGGIKGSAKNGKGFRLGNIVYNKGSGSKQYSLKYDLSKPLKSVTVYYYHHYNIQKDPLLIHLEFDTEGFKYGDQEFYKLTRDVSGLQWKKETNNEINISTTFTLLKYLDTLRYKLNKVVKIELQINTTKKYTLKGRIGNDRLRKYENFGSDEEIEVHEFSSFASEKLKSHKYTYFQHKLSSLSSQIDYNEIGGVYFTLPGQEEDIELKLYRDQNSNRQDEIIHLLYDYCMGDIYVYLYQNGRQVLETVPLLLFYNSKWYRPRSMDEYFTKWVDISYGLDGLKLDKPNQNDNFDRYINILDQINKDLNQINLERSDGNYGLPKTVKLGDKYVKVHHDFKTDRVNVTKYIVTSSTEDLILFSDSNGFDEALYLVVNHTTVNKGPVGHLRYHRNRIFLGQGDPFTVDSSINFVNLYYHKCDTSCSFPLLMGLGKVENEDTNLCYKPIELYERIPATGNELKFKKLEKIPKAGKEMRDKINNVNYNINHSVKIKLDYTNNNGQQGYPLVLIPPESLSSTELKNNQHITVPPPFDVKYNGITTGFKCFIHTIPQKDGKIDDKYIGSLKLFLPSKDEDKAESEINIIRNEIETDSISNAPLYYSSCSYALLVYFYENDPRPLMVSYDNMFFRPHNLDDYFKNWVLDDSIDGCSFDETTYMLLSKLIYVSNILNPVKISTTNTGTYTIHNFNGKDIKIKVDETSGSDKFCYKCYIHTHNGIGDGGTGFRLGYLLFNDSRILDINGRVPEQSITATNSNSPTYSSFDQVVVYYYAGDKSHRNPLLVALCKVTDGGDMNGICTSTTNCKCQPYYELQGASKDPKEKRKYKKQDKPITLEESEGSDLEKALNNIRIHIGSTLRVFLNNRTNYQGRLYKCKCGKLVKGNVDERPGGSKTTGKPESDLPPQTQVEVSEQTKCKQLVQSGYKCYKHDLRKADTEETLIGGLRLLLYESQDKPLTLHGSDGMSIHTKFQDQFSCHKDNEITPVAYTCCKGDLYAYFYGEDPRPLLLCYGGRSYKPKKLGDPEQNNQVRVDYTSWTLVNNITQCTCNGGDDKHINHILDTLLEVALILNPVQLNPHQIPTSPSSHIMTNEQLKAPKEATYDLHKFTAIQTVKMKITRTNVECYEKYTYEPGGTTGKNAKGFRLGTVLYRDSITVKPENSVNYTECGKYKYNPLKSVDVYYYDEDSRFEEPLLIVLFFGNVGDSGNNEPKEYWKLTTRDINDISWEIDKPVDESIVKCQDTLVRYLDGIRYSLKKLIRIELQYNSTIKYNLTGRSSTGPSGSGFATLGTNKKIEVVEGSDSGCQKLKENNYTCFIHRLSSLQSYDYHKIGGVVMTLPSKNGYDQAVEIPLHEVIDQKGPIQDKKIEQLAYNKCMGDVYVYFYFKTCTNRVDTVPLMLFYNNRFYTPKNRDEYLIKWVPHPLLDKPKVICGSDSPILFNNYNLLIKALNNTNEELNRIELTYNIGGSPTCKYGIPTDNILPDEPAIDLTRVEVTKITNKYQNNRPYVKLAHRTINGFRIGDIYYGSDEILNNGVKINGATGGSDRIITIDKNGDGTNNHWEFSNTYKPNTVVTYYSITDETYNLPQLILLISTTHVGDPIKSSDRTKYGYYILTTGDRANNYHYEWRQNTETPARQLILNYETEFLLFHAIVILLDKNPSIQVERNTSNSNYGENELKLAIQSAIATGSLKGSPGVENDINRLKNKQVILTEIGEESCESPLKGSGFKLIKHDITSFVKPDIKGAENITLLTGLRFLIPTWYGGDQYKVLSLYGSYFDEEPSSLYHQKDKNSFYVYFYGQDPRPLILFCNDTAYIPIRLKDYFTKWVLNKKVEMKHSNGKNEPLMRLLVYVSNILNPVIINKHIRSRYTIHSFNNQNITIHLTAKESDNKFCYNSYTHKPTTGFRLGYLLFNDSRILDINGRVPEQSITATNSNSPTYSSFDQVVVYYYKGDTTYSKPLIIALSTNDSPKRSTIYYKLLKEPITIGPSGPLKYKKVINSIELIENSNNYLDRTLDEIRFQMSKTLVLLLNKRESYKSYVYENNNIIISCAKKVVNVQVTDTSYKSTVTGYKCYEHNIKGLDKAYEICRLKLFLSDDKAKDGEKNMIIFKNSSYVEEISMDPLCYSICKGNIYVFLPDNTTTKPLNPELPSEFKDFPLMLNFNEAWYKPKIHDKRTEWTQDVDLNQTNLKVEHITPETIKNKLDKITNLLKEQKLKEKKQPETEKLPLKNMEESRKISEPSNILQEEFKQHPETSDILQEEFKQHPETSDISQEEFKQHPETSDISQEEFKQLPETSDISQVREEDISHSDINVILKEKKEFFTNYDSEEIIENDETIDFDEASITFRSDSSLEFLSNMLMADDTGFGRSEIEIPIFQMLSNTMEYPEANSTQDEVVSLQIPKISSSDLDIEHKETHHTSSAYDILTDENLHNENVRQAKQLLNPLKPENNQESVNLTPQALSLSTGESIPQVTTLQSTDESTPGPSGLLSAESTLEPHPLLATKTSPEPIVLQSRVENTGLDNFNHLLGYSIGGTIGSLIIIGSATFILVRRYRKIELTDMMPLLY